MSIDNIRDLIEKYKKGELGKEEAAELENKLDEFCALLELADQRSVDACRVELPDTDSPQAEKISKGIKKRISLRLIGISVVSVVIAAVVFTALFFGISGAMDKIYNPDKEAGIIERTGRDIEKYPENMNISDIQKIWRAVATIKDLTSPFGYMSTGAAEAKGFSKWEFNFWYNDYLGKTVLKDRTKLTINYFLGKPYTALINGFQAEAGGDSGIHKIFREFYQNSLYEAAPNDNYYSPHYEAHGFEDLDRVPAGTQARAVVCFNKKIGREEYKEFAEQVNVRYRFIDTGFPEPGDKKSLTSLNEEQARGKMLLGRPVDNNLWHQDLEVILMSHRGEYDTEEFETKHFIASLRYMQKYDGIARLIYPGYKFDYDSIADYIGHNGVKYIGAVVEGDSRELLKLRENPLVHCIEVENVVVW